MRSNADDVGSQRTQTIVDVLVASVNLVDVVDGALAFGAERGDEEADASPNVR
mgnify:CR=1 FL=1